MSYYGQRLSVAVPVGPWASRSRSRHTAVFKQLYARAGYTLSSLGGARRLSCAGGTGEGEGSRREESGSPVRGHGGCSKLGRREYGAIHSRGGGGGGQAEIMTVGWVKEKPNAREEGTVWGTSERYGP